MSILAIDPGSDTLGAAVLSVHLPSWSIVRTQANTYSGLRLSRTDPWTDYMHGNRINRIAALEDALVQLCREVQPLEVASESPFINKRFPQAGIALTEVLSAIRAAVMRYDMWTPMRLVDPPTVKNAVGVKGNAGGPEGKAKMLEAVMRLAPVLNYTGIIPLEQLDEHSIDAIAVGYSRYLALKEELCL